MPFNPQKRNFDWSLEEVKRLDRWQKNHEQFRSETINFIENRNTEKLISLQMDFQQRQLEKNQGYNNTIATLGFAGLLTAFNFLSGRAAEIDMTFALLLLFISLILFVLWTISIMIIAARLAKEYPIADNRLNTEQLLRKLEKWEKMAQAKQQKLRKLWTWLFTVSLGTGLICATVLMMQSFFVLMDVKISLVEKLFDLIREFI